MSVVVLVAEDEAPARAELVALLSADPRVAEVHAASSGAEALRLLERVDVAVAFLDIHMPGLSGLDLAAALGALARPPAIVFVTADDAHAVDAFELRALDYLLKPVRADRLRRAVDRIVVTEPPADGDEVLPVTVGSTVRFVHRRDVRWVRAEGDYTRLHTDAASGHLVRIPISELETRWADAGFVRIHRSFLVRAASVTEVRLSGAEPAVWVGDTALPVSRRFAPLVREALIGRGGA